MVVYDLAFLTAWVAAGGKDEKRQFRLEVLYLLTGRPLYRCGLSRRCGGKTEGCEQIAPTPEQAIENTHALFATHVAKDL